MKNVKKRVFYGKTKKRKKRSKHENVDKNFNWRFFWKNLNFLHQRSELFSHRENRVSLLHYCDMKIRRKPHELSVQIDKSRWTLKRWNGQDNSQRGWKHQRPLPKCLLQTRGPRYIRFTHSIPLFNAAASFSSLWLRMQHDQDGTHRRWSFFLILTLNGKLVAGVTYQNINFKMDLTIYSMLHSDYPLVNSTICRRVKDKLKWFFAASSRRRCKQAKCCSNQHYYKFKSNIGVRNEYCRPSSICLYKQTDINKQLIAYRRSIIYVKLAIAGVYTFCCGVYYINHICLYIYIYIYINYMDSLVCLRRHLRRM